MSLSSRCDNLRQTLTGMRRVAVAFSGGVDSTLLLKVACDVLGPQQVLALTATSPIFSQREFDWCREFTRQLQVRHIPFAGDELQLDGFVENGPERCYHCKRNLYQHFLTICSKEGYPFLVDGSNLDDLKDYRPGRRAVEELGIRTPLLDAGLDKEAIRDLSRRMNLPTWNKRALACLATRFPYGTRITRDRVEQVGRCEAWLHQQGFANYRVRAHDNLARIEVCPEEMLHLCAHQLKDELINLCKANGFDYVTLDLQGFRSGSMNECLPTHLQDRDMTTPSGSTTDSFTSG